MKELILKQLQSIEKTFNVKVLFAVESGSRAWGFPSQDSDYDVRFIYIHPTEWYLSIAPQGIGKKRDVIELPINEQLDISGWEITKALRLFRKSNPAIFEWLRSDIIYFQQYNFIPKVKLLEKDYYNPKALLYHYINIAKNNILQHQQKHIKLKNYLYALRSIFACKWIELYDEIPPIKFQDLIGNLKLNEQLIFEIEDLLERKKSGTEIDLIESKPIVEEYIRKEIIRLNLLGGTLTTLKKDRLMNTLDNLFRDTLKEVWERTKL